MNFKITVLGILVIFTLVLFVFNYAAVNNSVDENIEKIKNTGNHSTEFIEEEKNDLKYAEGKVTTFVQEFTDENAEILYKEKESQLYVVKVGKELYKVLFDTEDEDIEYMIYKDELVYER